MKTKKHHDYRDHPCKCGKPNGFVTIRVNRNWLCTDCISDQGWMLCGQHKSGPVWFFENSRVGCPVCARTKIAEMLKSQRPSRAARELAADKWTERCLTPEPFTTADISWLKAQRITL